MTTESQPAPPTVEPTPTPPVVQQPTKAGWPIVATIIVAACVATMIGLGFWQLGRAAQKDALIASYSANMALPATAYPASNPADHSYLYRIVSANCLRVVEWRELAGRTADGRAGWRHIATCATGAEGPGLLVDVGVSEDTQASVAWTGGTVRGRATLEPDEHSALSRMMGGVAPLRLMIVAETAAPGLTASAQPDPSAMPSNHLSYAVQWFLFAFVASVIFVLAVRLRRGNASA